MRLLEKQITLKLPFCASVKRITLRSCLCSSPSVRFSVSRIRNIMKFGAKKYFTDQRAANTIICLLIQLNLVICFYKKEIFRVYSFSEPATTKGNSLEAV